MSDKISSDLVVATNVSFEDYMEHYAHDHHEWQGGTVIKMAPIHDKHDMLFQYFVNLFGAYLELRPIGKLRVEPFVMKLPNVRSARQPDAMVILDTNPHQYTPTGMMGPADICVEIISPESIDRDYHTKKAEYEQGGVREYWIIDWIEQECNLLRLDENGAYITIKLGEEETFTSEVLPKLAIHVPTLWQAKLPGPGAISRAVENMLK